MKRTKDLFAFSLFGSLTAAALASIAVGGCGGSSVTSTGDGGADGSTTGPEASADHHAGSDTGNGDSSNLPEVGTETGGDASSCPTVATGAKQILNLVSAGLTGGIQILGITADGTYVVYMGYILADGGAAIASENVYAAPLAGGTVSTIFTNLNSSADFKATTPADAGAYLPVSLDQNTVFVWNNVSEKGVGALSFWNTTTKTTTAVPAATASAAFAAAASPDSTKIVYSTGVGTTGLAGALVASDTATITATPSTLIANTEVSILSTGFVPSIGFPSNTYVVASHQELSTGPITISAWDSTAWGENDLVTPAAAYSTSVPAWDADTAGDHIAAVTSTGQVQVFPLPGTIASAIDVGLPGNSQFLLFKKGDGILYGAANSLSSNTIPLGTANSLVTATGTGAFLGLYTEFGPLGPSPDESQILYYSTLDTSTNGVSLYLVPNSSSPGTPEGIVATNSGAVFGDVFTADSKYLIYIDQLTSAGGAINGSIGQLNVWDVAGKKTIAVSDKTDWDSNSLTGSTVLYNDNFGIPGATSSSTVGIADIKTVDVSAATLAPTLIQAQGDMNYYLTTDKTKMVFSLTVACSTNAAGIYSYTF